MGTPSRGDMPHGRAARPRGPVTSRGLAVGRGRAVAGSGARLPPPPVGRGRSSVPPRLPAVRPQPASSVPPPAGFRAPSRVMSGSSPFDPNESRLSQRIGEVSLTGSGSSREVTTSTDPEESSPLSYLGTSGKLLEVTANYLRLNVDPHKGVYEYEVRFEPRIDGRDQRYRLVNQLREMVGPVKVFDGVKLFVPKKMESTKGSATNGETGQLVEVSFHFKRQKRAGDRDVVQLYNLLFGRIMRTLKFSQHNRKYYNAAAAHDIEQHRLSVWPGYVTAVDQYEGGLLLQLDVSHRVLRTETARDLLVSLKRRGVSDLKAEAERALLGASVLTRYNNKSYKIDDLDFKSSPKDCFTNERGQTIAYMQYYKDQYGIQIQDPDQPMIVHRPRKKAVGEEEVSKLVYLVPELCLLTGMTDAMRADFRVMQDVAKFTRLSPAQRQEGVNSFVKSVLENETARKHLTDWGLELVPKTSVVAARQLNPPKLFFGKGYSEQVGPKGDWGRTATTKAVLTGESLSKWAIFFTDKSEAPVKEFCRILQQQGPKMGINVANPKVVSLPNDRTDTYIKAMRDLIKPGVELVLAVVPQQKADRYAAIKKLCCIEKPVASQVICLKTITNPKRLSSVVQKVALQINCKLGGELWACSIPVKHLMVVGIDVYHEKRQKSGSVAGLVASINSGMSRYYSRVAIQNKGQEIIDALKVAFMDALLKYYDANQAFPEEIVVYRDGVGDGQLDTIDKHEAEQFVEAFKYVTSPEVSLASVSGSDMDSSGISFRKRLAEILPDGYDPGFTFVVVQKRINTRIYTVRGQGFENPPPGTVLDHTVTRYRFKDFFLVPQVVNQGTVTPTHFVVTREGKKLGADAIQKISYYLTHMYYNWPGTVRVPAPCQYAHKLVDLVGEHLHNQPSPSLNDKLYYL